MKFVVGKARVAPIKRMTIPKLGLQVAVYAAQLLQFARKEQKVQIEKNIFRSDSKTVLFRPRTPEICHRIFVANSLAKILDVSAAYDWI